VVGVHREVSRVNVVALEHHLQNLRLMDGTFLHKVQNLILLSDGVVHVVVKLELHLVLELPVLLERLLVLGGISKVLVILGQ
jgi:hypothetical protein